MKFLYLCADPGIPVLGAKGASVHVREFVNALMNRGHTVTLVCANRGYGNEPGFLSITEIPPHPGAVDESSLAELKAQVPALPLGVDAPRGTNKLLDAELDKWAYNFQLRPALERIIAEIRPDVLYERYALFSDAGSRVAQQHQLPFLLEVNAPLIQERQASSGMILTDLAQHIEDQVFRRADLIIGVSRILRDYVIERGADPDRAVVIPNGVDLDKFHPTRGDQDRKIANLQGVQLPPDLLQRTVIGFVGSLKPWHGVDVLVKAFVRARQTDPKLFLLIVGEGPELQHLKMEAQSQGLSGDILFTGAVPHRLIPHYIALMNITVAPYRHQPRFYFSPMKIIEYMAMGKPVIATRQGQILELIQHQQNGLLYEAEDVESLADTLLYLAANADVQARLGQDAERTVAPSHNWPDIADRVTRMTESLLRFKTSHSTTIGAYSPIYPPSRSTP